MEMLPRVMEMQNQGVPDEEIFEQLRNEGASPKDISEAINQARVKSAVVTENDAANQTMGNPSDFNQEYPSTEYQPYNPLAAATQNEPAEQPEMNSQYSGYYPQTPQAYPEQQSYYMPPETTNTETISEIAEQVVAEKISELKIDVDSINSFKSKVDEQISDLDYRLKRIEGMIDKINQSIAEKILSIDDNSSMIQKDLDNIHGTMSKLMNPLVDRYNELPHHEHKK